jgi:hypothetical protein
MRALTICATSTFLAALLLQPALAGESKKAAATTGEPSATLELASEQMRLIMGGSAGKGVLHFQGKDYAFTFKSSSAGVGARAVTSVSAVGRVYGLTRIEDFEGKYTSVVKSVVTGTSEAKATYTSEKGVTIDVRGTVKGAGLSLGGGMATIKLVK